MQLSRVYGWAAVVILAACGEQTGVDMSTPAASQGPIYYGESAPTLYTMTSTQQQATVAVCAYYGCICTGTLISDRVVLTAAHCLDLDDAVMTAGDFQIHFGSNSSSEVDAKSVIAIHYRSRYHYGQDIGLLVMASATSVATPIPIKTTDLNGLLGQNAQAVGYGMTEFTHHNTIRYWTTIGVRGIGDEIMVDGEGVTGVAHGDSGGPLLYDFGSGLRVTGALSSGEEGYVGKSVYTSVIPHEDWILAIVDQYSSACSGACSGKACGMDGACHCGDCARGNECVSGQCQPMAPGAGGACVTSDPPVGGCTTGSCANGEVCLNRGGGYSECAKVCGPEPCAAGDYGSYCQTLYSAADSHTALCLETNPLPCSAEGTMCAARGGRPGICVQLYDGEPAKCWGTCMPAEVCPIDAGCAPMNVCNEVCTNTQCGQSSGCDCGECPTGYECVNNLCKEECHSLCELRQCGSDGCGGSCGVCGGGLVCNDYGRCLAAEILNGDDDKGCSAASGTSWATLACFSLLFMQLRRRRS